MHPSRRTLRWALVAFAALALIAGGVYVACSRARGEAERFAGALLADAEELALSVDPDLLGTLTFSPSDGQETPARRLGDLLSAHRLVSAARAPFLVALREGELRLMADGDASPTIMAPDLSAYRAMERYGSASLFPDEEAGVVIAMAPVRSGSTSVIVGAAGLQLDMKVWRAAALSEAWHPLLCSLLCAAVLLCSMALYDWRDRQPADRQQRWRHLETVIIATVSVLLACIVTATVRRTELMQRAQLFDAVSRSYIGSVRAELQGIQAELSSLGRFFASSDYVSRDEFATFAGSTRSAGVIAYEWVPAVEGGALPVIGALAEQEGLAGFRVWEMDAAGRVQPASGERTHYPVLYVEPFAGNEFAVGYDLASEPLRAQALARAAEEGLSSASDPVGLIQKVSPGWGTLVFQPVGMPGASTAAGTQRGFVVAVLQWERLAQAALAAANGEAPLVGVDIVDLRPTETGEPLLLASTASDAGSAAALAAGSAYPAERLTRERVVPLMAYGRPLALVYRPAEGFAALQPRYTWPAVALAGLSIGAILTLAVGILRQRETTLTRLLEERTQALAHSEAHYRALYEEALNPILVADADGRFVDANDSALAYLQRTRDDLLGKRLWDLAPKGNGRLGSRAQTPFGLRRTVEADLQVGEQVKTLLLNIIPVRRGDQMSLFAIGQDITDRKRSEEQLQRRYAFERTLAAASSRFVGNVSYEAAVRDTLADIGVLTGAGRAYLYTVDDETRGLSTAYEWCAPGVASQRNAIGSLSGDLVARWMERLAGGEIIVISDVEAMGRDARAESEALRAQAVQSIVALPVFAQGNLYGLVGLDNIHAPDSWEAEDISLLGTFAEILSSYLERLRAQDGRLDLERQLLESQKLESLGVLAGGIAHEFNNLLAAILGNLELARADLAQTSPVRQTLDESVAATLRAADLTRQMLAYSGKGHFVVTDLDLGALVEQNAHIFRAAIPRTATLDVNLGKNLPLVRGDAGQLQQVIMNLLSNAAEALDGGPGQVVLATGSNRLTDRALAGNRAGQELDAGEYVWLEVRDTGKGMDAETVARMFDPFYSTRGGGRGLGLGAVLGIIRGHKGGIWVQSTPERGTLVRIAFPALPRPAGDGRAGSEGHPLGRLSGGVLIVDDEDSVRRLNKNLLERMGLRTYVASRGEEAVTLYNEHHKEIDCVLLDLTMPGMDGVATLEALRRVDPTVRAVLCTGYGEQVASDRFRDLKLAGFVQKPFQIGDLRSVLEGALRSDGNGQTV